MGNLVPSACPNTEYVQPKYKNYNLSVLGPSSQVTKKPYQEKENNKTIMHYWERETILTINTQKCETLNNHWTVLFIQQPHLTCFIATAFIYV